MQDIILEAKLVGSIKGDFYTRDHGFPFKIFPRDRDLLFPEAIEYDLEQL